MKTPPLSEKIKANTQLARAVRADFSAAGVCAVTVVGPAGAGKSSLVEAALARLDRRVRAAVLVSHVDADRQAARFRQRGFSAAPIHSDVVGAAAVKKAAAALDLHQLDLLFIESNGSELDPLTSDLGHHLRIGVFSVAGGNGAVARHPLLITGTDLVLLSKTDLLPGIRFDPDAFARDVHRLRPGLDIIQTSLQRNQGIDTWLNWLEFHAGPGKKRNLESPRLFHPFSNWSNG